MNALSDFAKALLASWLCIALFAALAALVLGGCAATFATTVRRADSMGDVHRIGNDLGAEGWRVVDVAQLDGGSFIVVLERKAVR